MPKSTDPPPVSNDVLSAILEQFIENNNLRRKLFIQFFLGVMVVIVGYAVVYSNTSTSASFWDIRRGESDTIVSYSIVSLIAAYFIAQSVLILLNRYTLSSGYSFRKYQGVVYKIRRGILDPEKFDELFERNYTPFRKKGCFSGNSFLPEFETVFFSFMWIFQIVLFVTLVIKLGTFTDETVQILINARDLVYFEEGHYYQLISLGAIHLVLLPIWFTCIFQMRYYFKYLRQSYDDTVGMLDDWTADEKKGYKVARRDYQDALNEYYRKISLTWGYLLLCLLFLLSLIVLQIINHSSDCHYLYHWGSRFYLTVFSGAFFGCFLYNLRKAQLKMREAITKESVLNIKLNRQEAVCKDGVISKFRIKRSQCEKVHRAIPPWLLTVLALMILISIVFVERDPFSSRWIVEPVGYIVLLSIYFSRPVRDRYRAGAQKRKDRRIALMAKKRLEIDDQEIAQKDDVPTSDQGSGAEEGG